MAKNKTEIHVTTVFDGEQDASEVFVSLIAQKYNHKKRIKKKEYHAKEQNEEYNKDVVQKTKVPFGLCG